VFNEVAMYWPTIPSQSCKYALPTILDPDPPGFQTEEVVEEIKIWKNAKISLIEMDADRDMKDGIRAQIAKTNLIIVNQSMEKRMDWNTKSTIEIIFKNY